MTDYRIKTVEEYRELRGDSHQMIYDKSMTAIDDHILDGGEYRCGEGNRRADTFTTSKHNQFQFRRPDWTPYPKPQPGLHPRLAALVDTRPT